ncbi:hypothetical protein L0244_26695 [bacterium]|nr:hypothetical protein [bacterium]
MQVQLPQNSSTQRSERLTLRETEKQHITSVLESTNWVIKGPRGAAKVLGLKPSTLYNKMNRLGIAHARGMRRSNT